MNTTAARDGDTRLYASLALALLLCRLLASRLLLAYDDAFITFTYARNLAEGHGFVYYPGDVVLGTTAPLFGLLASLFYLLRLPMPGTAVVMNALFDVAVLLLTVGILPARQRRPVAVVFTALLAVSPIVSRVSVGAMETSLYLAASLAAVAAFHRGRRALAFTVASLAYFLRPEAVLLLVVLAVVQIRSGRAGQTLRLALLSVTCLAIPLAAIYLVYGQVLPQSVVAKSGAGSSLAVVLRRLLAPDPLQAVLMVPALWGGVVTARTHAAPVRMLAAWAVLYVLAYAVARPHVWSWYGALVFYAVILLASFGIADLARRIRLDGLLRRATFVIAVTPVLVWTAGVVRTGPTPERRLVRERTEAWCVETIHDRATTIAASDIGVIGYYSRARILDLNGLVWPRAAAYDSWRGAIKAEEPDYLFLNASRSTYDIMRDPEVVSRYRPLVRFSDRAGAALELTERDTRGGWRPDYIVYRRVRPQESPRR